MKHRDTSKSVQIYPGIYSSTIFEMEMWTQLENYRYTDEEYRRQLEENGTMKCGLLRECVGLFPTKERALNDLDEMSCDFFAEGRELSFTFIRERVLYCMMEPSDYLKEWTYTYGDILHDESLVRNYDARNNPFHGRPDEMIHFRRGDIVMIPDLNGGHWGIVSDTPPTTDCPDMDWTDDSYTIITSPHGITYHEHVLSHHVIPPTSAVPVFVCQILEAALKVPSGKQNV